VNIFKRRKREPQPIELDRQAVRDKVIRAAKVAAACEIERQLQPHFSGLPLQVDVPINLMMDLTPFEVEGRQVMWR